MKVQINIALLSIVIAILSFVGAVFFNKYSIVFWCDVLIGVFTGSIFSFAVSVIAYHGEKKRVLRDIYLGCSELEFTIPRIMRYCIEGTIDELSESLKTAIDCFNTKLLYSFSDFQLINKHSALQKNIVLVGGYAKVIYKLLIDDSYYLDRFFIGSITVEEMESHQFKCGNDQFLSYLGQFNNALGDLRNYISKSKEETNNAD